MGMDNFDALEKKLGQLDYYKPLFADAFGDNLRERREQVVLESVTLYFSLVSINSIVGLQLIMLLIL